jgi:hypothetical protein
MSKNTGGPAFPHKVFMGARINYSTNLEEFVYSEQPGAITLRDYFAAKAMPEVYSRVGSGGFELVAKLAYEMADAMIKEREK